jgi:hypothetical protein
MTASTAAILPKNKTVRTRLTDGTDGVRSHREFSRPITPWPPRRAPVNRTMHGHGRTKPPISLPRKPAPKNYQGKP